MPSAKIAHFGKEALSGLTDKELRENFFSVINENGKRWMLIEAPNMTLFLRKSTNHLNYKFYAPG